MTQYKKQRFSLGLGTGVCFENCKCLICRREREEKETEKNKEVERGKKSKRKGH